MLLFKNPFVGIGISVPFMIGTQYETQWLNTMPTFAYPPNQVAYAVDTFVTGNLDTNAYSVMTNSNWWTINHGSVYEQSIGYKPNITYCGETTITSDYCTYKYVIRNMVDLYHKTYPTSHIKQITGIEPRGKAGDRNQGCYYSFNQVEYDPTTNIESDIVTTGEIIQGHTIRDYATCTYKPDLTAQDSEGSANGLVIPSRTSNYQVRTLTNPATNQTIYPTRKSMYTSDLFARYIRIRPSTLAADGILNITRIEIYDNSNNLVSNTKGVIATATSTNEAGLSAQSVLNGSVTPGTTQNAVWSTAASSTGSGSGAQYFDIDLSDNVNISRVVYYGSSIPLPLTGTESYPANASDLAGARAASAALVAPILAGLNTAVSAINNAVTDVANAIHTIQDGLNSVSNALGFSSFSIASASDWNSGNTAGQGVAPPSPTLTALQRAAAVTQQQYGIAASNAAAAAAAASLYRNYGVKVQFLYSNTPNEAPIFEYTLPNDTPIQTISLYSSVTQVPIFPVSGPLNIPSPQGASHYLGDPTCPYKCEDRVIIDNLVAQYNATNTTDQIMGVLQAKTTSPTTCEFQVDIVTQNPNTTSKDATTWPDGSKVAAPTVSRVYLTTTLAPTIQPTTTPVVGRYIFITPSFTPTTTLEISKILVYNVPTATNSAVYEIAQHQPMTFYNAVQATQVDMYINRSPLINQVLDGTATPQAWTDHDGAPNFFIAATNDPATYFEVDLGQNDTIAQIVFVGRSDTDRKPGGILNIKIEIFEDQQADEGNATSGKYPPVFSYRLPTDACTQTITVAPPPICSFAISSAAPSMTPVYLTGNVPTLTATDTSGGVFTVDSLVSTTKSTWNYFNAAGSTDPLSPALPIAKEIDTTVHNMLDTVAGSATLLNTPNRCKDRAILAQMMHAYNKLHDPNDTDDFGTKKRTMTQIIKSGPSMTNSCDVLFQERVELYDAYIVDITDPAKSYTQLNATRFFFTAGPGGTVTLTADAKNIRDISSNALGIISDTSIVTPIFKGPDSLAVDCRNPANMRAVKAALERANSGTVYTDISESFQSTTLVCEYALAKNQFGYRGLVTYAKAFFANATTLSQATEYDPASITPVKNPATGQTLYFKNNKQITLPNLMFYDSNHPSTRVNNATYYF
jgi:hypothetical protein